MRKIIRKLRELRSSIQDLGVRRFCFLHFRLVSLGFWARALRLRHKVLDERALLSRKKSDTLVIFGSGWSLNDISPSQWQALERFNTLGFSGFIYQKWICPDYLLIRGWVESWQGLFNWWKIAHNFTRFFREGKNWRQTTVVLQGDYSAFFSKSLIASQALPRTNPLFFFKTNRESGPPTMSFADGLRHGPGTLCDTINFGVCGGWKRIILAGVDLYDNRYFYLGPDETITFDPVKADFVPGKINPRGRDIFQSHNTVNNGIVKLIGEWGQFLLKNGIKLYVLNPKSMLAEVIPVFDLAKDHAGLQGLAKED